MPSGRPAASPQAVSSALSTPSFIPQGTSGPLLFFICFQVNIFMFRFFIFYHWPFFLYFQIIFVDYKHQSLHVNVNSWVIFNHLIHFSLLLTVSEVFILTLYIFMIIRFFILFHLLNIPIITHWADMIHTFKSCFHQRTKLWNSGSFQTSVIE